MACQSGIRANEQLLRFFNECRQGKVRLGKIVVKNEQLFVNFKDNGTSDWRADFQRNLPDCVDSFEPCFIVFRLDSPTNWLLITFADDRAPVREKMLLASTRATFKSEFGPCNIQYEYHVTNKRELTLDAFDRWMKSSKDPAPLTEVEREIENAYKEQKTINSSAVAAQTLKGVLFPMDGDAEEALRQLASGKLEYVQLSVDTLNEAIKLERTEAQLPAENFSEMVPRDKPRYHFYRFLHIFDDVKCDPIMFIYSMPSSGCTIKERMLYSSCKQPFLQSVLQNVNIKPATKIEIDSKERLSFESLLEYVHPPSEVRAKGFAKPPGPPQRGSKRIIKAGL